MKVRVRIQKLTAHLHIRRTVIEMMLITHQSRLSCFLLMSVTGTVFCLDPYAKYSSTPIYDSLHEYAQHHRPAASPKKSNKTADLMASASSIDPRPPLFNYESEEILTAVYEAKKQLPSFASDKNDSGGKERKKHHKSGPNRRSGSGFSISNLFERAGHHLATKLFGGEGGNVKGQGGGYPTEQYEEPYEQVYKTPEPEYHQPEPPSYRPPEPPSYRPPELPSYRPPEEHYSNPPATTYEEHYHTITPTYEEHYSTSSPPNYDYDSSEGHYGYSVLYQKGKHVSNIYGENGYSTTPVYVYDTIVKKCNPINDRKGQSQKVGPRLSKFGSGGGGGGGGSGGGGGGYGNSGGGGGYGNSGGGGYDEGDYGGGGGGSGGGGGGGGYKMKPYKQQGSGSGSGKDLVMELKDKLKSLFMMVLPLVPIALILATVIPSSVFIPARSGTMFLPLNGTTGVNIMNLTPGTQVGIPARRANTRQGDRPMDYAKRLKDAQRQMEPAIDRVLALAESSGLLNGTMVELVKNLGPLFVKHAQNVLAQSPGNEVLVPKMKALIMEKILRRVGHDLVASIKTLERNETRKPLTEPEGTKKLIEPQPPPQPPIPTPTPTPTPQPDDSRKENSLFPLDFLKDIAQLFGYHNNDLMLNGLLNLVKGVNDPGELSKMAGAIVDFILQSNQFDNILGNQRLRDTITSFIQQFVTASDMSSQFSKPPNSKRRSRRRVSSDEDDRTDNMLYSLEKSLRNILAGSNEQTDKEESFTSKAMSTWKTVRDQLHKFLTRGNDDPGCIQRIICQSAHLGQDDDASLPQKVLWKIVSRLQNVAPSQFGIRALMKNARTGSCSRYRCPLSKLGFIFF